MALHTAPQAPESSGARPRRPFMLWGAIGVVVVLVAVVGFFMFGGGQSTPPPDSGSGPTGALPLSNTFTTIEGAPLDTQATSTTEGLVVHPVRTTPVHASPGGKAIAQIEPQQFGPTWLPVIGQQPDWVQVLLPSKPNGSTGWIRAADTEHVITHFVIKVHLKSMKMELTEKGKSVGTWSIGIGKPDTPTPPGRTFVLGQFKDPKQSFSPVIIPLGTHSPTLDTYGGGPGTVGIHGWPNDDVLGTASSDGCIRIPADALAKLTEVPLGTLVMIDEN
ncbi:L,D-transpeptidase [Actinomycetes bacterium KLBMP 9759]